MMQEAAVSPVLGEVLMITLVLILVPVVTISLMNQLPEDRIPTITIIMGPLNGSSVSLFHKGGDWIHTDSIKIQVNGDTISSWKGKYSKSTFDLGDRIEIFEIPNQAVVSVIIKNSVIFTGVAQT